MAKRGPRQLPRRERFYSKVDVLSPDGCWLWSGVVNLKRGGYGYFYDDDTRRGRAHRVAWEIMYEIDLPPSIVLMHTCDDPRCVNVDHLVPGTQTMNLADMRRKGRGVVPEPEYGMQRYNATLNDDLGRQARSEFVQGGVSAVEVLANQAGVNQKTLIRAATGKSWRHVQ